MDKVKGRKDSVEDTTLPQSNPAGSSTDRSGHEVNEQDTKPPQEKPKIKGLVKKLMIRSKSTVSVPRSSAHTLEAPSAAIGTIVIPKRTRSGLQPLSPLADGAIDLIRPGGETQRRRAFSADVVQTLHSRRQSDSEVTSPVPLDSPADIAGVEELDDHTVEGLFENVLPYELKIQVFKSLIALHVVEHARAVRMGKWKGERAKERWYGETAGRREVIRLGSVSLPRASGSRSWLTIAGRHCRSPVRGERYRWMVNSGQRPTCIHSSTI